VWADKSVPIFLSILVFFVLFAISSMKKMKRKKGKINFPLYPREIFRSVPLECHGVVK